MKTHVSTKYSFFLLFILLYSCGQEIKTLHNNTKSNNYNFQNHVIVKNNDTISLGRKFASLNTKFLDTLILKKGAQKTEIVFPSIGYYHVELRNFLPNRKIYNFSNDKFLIQANYRGVFIQYVFNGRIDELDGIFIITDIDEKYPDNNKSMMDSIAKIESIEVAVENKKVYDYLYKFSHSFMNNQLQIKKTYYVQRKEGLKKYIY